jgi:hypothetical protein
MLVEKQAVKPGDIVVLKTVTGDEVISKLLSLDDTSISLNKPILLKLHFMGNGQGAVGFEPYMLGLDEFGKVTISLSHVVVMPAKARGDLASQYTKATTGLEVPNSKLVI